MTGCRNRGILLCIVVAAVAAVTFMAGRHIEKAENKAARAQKCSTLIVFAIDKAENQDLADEGVMKALISNVYAAYRYCDDSICANQLHDLWNYLIFESEDTAAAKEIVLQELNAVLRSVKQPDKPQFGKGV